MDKCHTASHESGHEDVLWQLHSRQDDVHAPGVLIEMEGLLSMQLAACTGAWLQAIIQWPLLMALWMAAYKVTFGPEILVDVFAVFTQEIQGFRVVQVD